jgi:hypothetical protein
VPPKITPHLTNFLNFGRFGSSASTPEPALLVLLVVLEVALEPLDMGVALEGEDVGADAVEEEAVVGDHHGAAGEVRQASSRARRVSTSRSLVGSSRRRTLPART